MSNLVITNPLPSGGQYTVYNSGSSCSHTFTVRVTAADVDDPVTGVTIFYQGTGENALSAPMVFVPAVNAWQLAVTVPNTWNIDDVIAFWVRGVDSHGNQSSDLHNSVVSQKVIIDICPPA